MLQTSPTLPRKYKFAKDQQKQSVHKFSDRISVLRLNTVCSCISEQRSVIRVLSPLVSSSRIFPFPATLLQASQCMFLPFLWVLFKSITEIRSILMATSMSVGRTCSRWETISSFSSILSPISSFAIEYTFLENG